MIRVAFQGNSIATRTGLTGIQEIIIQLKAIGNAAIPTDENGRVWIYYGDSDAGKVKEGISRYYVSAVDIIKGRIGKERLTGKTWHIGDVSYWIKGYSTNPSRR